MKTWVAVGVIALVLLALVGGAITSPLSMVDDHEIVSYLMTPETLAARLQADFTFGRFRPLYYALRQGLALAFGADPLPWHILVFAVGVVSLALLYATIRAFVRPALALVGALLPLLYPGAAAIWYRLGPQETIGVLLILGALYALSTNRLTWFVVLAAMSFYYKESFALLMPALVALRYVWGRIHGEPLRRGLPALVALFLLGAIPLALMLLLKVGGIGNGDESSGRVGGLLIKNLALLLLPSAGLLPVVLALVYHRRWILPAACVLGLWLIPQAALYGVYLDERYFWPGIIAPALCVPVALAALPRGTARLVAACALILCGLLSVPALLEQHQNAERYSADNRAFQVQLATVIQANPVRAELPYPEPDDIEPRWSSVAYLRYYGYQGSISFGSNCEGFYCAVGLVAPGAVLAHNRVHRVITGQPKHAPNQR